LLAQRAKLAGCIAARTRNRNHERRTIQLIAEIDSNGTHRSLYLTPKPMVVGKVLSSFVQFVSHTGRFVGPSLNVGDGSIVRNEIRLSRLYTLPPS